MQKTEIYNLLHRADQWGDGEPFGKVDDSCYSKMEEICCHRMKLISYEGFVHLNIPSLFLPGTFGPCGGGAEHLLIWVSEPRPPTSILTGHLAVEV